MKYASGYIPGAAWLNKRRFRATVETCMMTILTAMTKRDIEDRAPTACLTPSFDRLALEIRAAMARACNREINVIGWEELTPLAGTPGVTKHGQNSEVTISPDSRKVELDIADWATVLAALNYAFFDFRETILPVREKLEVQLGIKEEEAA